VLAAGHDLGPHVSSKAAGQAAPNVATAAGQQLGGCGPISRPLAIGTVPVRVRVALHRDQHDLRRLHPARSIRTKCKPGGTAISQLPAVLLRGDGSDPRHVKAVDEVRSKRRAPAAVERSTTVSRSTGQGAHTQRANTSPP
jgi:hypothetical protein